MSAKSPRQIDVELGRTIRASRMLIGMSQAQLGAELGLTFQQVQKYERGANRVSAGRLHEIAVVLGLPIGTFFDGAGDSTVAIAPGSEDAANALTRDGVRLIKALRRIADRQTRMRVIELAETLAAAQDRRPARSEAGPAPDDR